MPISKKAKKSTAIINIEKYLIDENTQKTSKTHDAIVMIMGNNWIE